MMTPNECAKIAVVDSGSKIVRTIDSKMQGSQAICLVRLEEEKNRVNKKAEMAAMKAEKEQLRKEAE